MPTDTASRTITVDAPLDQVLTTIRDIESQPEWVKEVLEAEVLEECDDGTPAKARFKASTPVGSDRYTLAYEHSDDGMTWHLLEGRLQTAQDASYELRVLDRQQTEVTFRLTITHNLPLPGFLRSRVINGLVASTVSGLKQYVEAAS
jgi:uncharacterized membrane protein